MLTDGIFSATIAGHSWIVSSAGNPGFQVLVDVLDPLDGTSTPMYGTIYLSDNEKGLRMSRQQFKAIGVDPDAVEFEHNEIPGLYDAAGNSISLIDSQVEVTLKTDSYTGSPQLKVDKFGGAPPAPPASALKKAQAALRAVASKTPGRTTSRPATVSQTRPQPTTGGDDGTAPDPTEAPDAAANDMPF